MDSVRPAASCSPTAQKALLPGSGVAKRRVAYQAFGDSASFQDDLFSTYRHLYQCAPLFESTVTLGDDRAFEYCQRRKYFVLVIPYSAHREFLLEGGFADDRMIWHLVGGSLKCDRRESFIDATHRHMANTVPGIDLGENEPIAFVHNRFNYRDTGHDHYGIVFVGRIRNPEPLQRLREVGDSRAELIPFDHVPLELAQTNNAVLLDLARKYLHDLDLMKVPEFEVAENVRYRHRYVLHRRIIKPLLRLFGRLPVFPSSIEDMEACVLSTMQSGTHGRILDVACGENRTVIEFGRLPCTDLVIGNDVSWSQIKLLGECGEANALVLFTNHDARHLPFCDGAFDFVICKNVLHHMEDFDSAQRLISEVVRVGKRSLIVEVMNPKAEGTWGRLRDRYYVDFLHDAGQHLLSRGAFEQLTDVPERATYTEMRTIRGIYQIATFVTVHEGGCTHTSHAPW